VQSDKTEIRQDRATLRTDRDAYQDAVQKFGRDSTQAKTAEQSLDNAQIALHKEIGDFRQDEWDVHKDRRDLAMDRRDVTQDANAANVKDQKQDQYDLNKDVQDLKDDKPEIQQDRTALRNANNAYQQAVQQFGATSPQAKTAEQNVDNAQITLHKATGDFRQDQWDIHKDRMDLAQDKTKQDQYDLNKDVQDAKDDKKTVHKDRETLRKDRDLYQDAVKKYGDTSTQAKAAEQNLDTAQVALHKEKGDFRQDLWDIHKDRMAMVETQQQKLRDLHTAYDQAVKAGNKDQAKNLKKQMADMRKQMQEEQRHQQQQQEITQQRQHDMHMQQPMSPGMH